MSMTLTTARTDIRQLLDDTGTDRYSNAMIDEALEVALLEYSKRKPVSRTYVLDSTASRRITLPADFIAMAIVDVEWVSNLADFNDRIAFYATKPDEQWVLETPGNIIPLGETMNIYYHTMHTIDGFNGESGTSVPDSDEGILELGAAGFASLAHATSKVETNNLNPQEAKDMAAHGRDQIERFYAGIGMVESVFSHASWADKTIDRNY